MNNNLGGWQVLKSGGNLNNGTQAGVSALNANNGSANANDNIGCQLTEYVKNIFSVIHTTALAENKSSTKVLVTRVNALGVT